MSAGARDNTHLRHVIERGAREPKVADLEFAVAVGEDVLGLEVAVEDLGCREGTQGDRARGRQSGRGRRRAQVAPIASHTFSNARMQYQLHLAAASNGSTLFVKCRQHV